jgi:transposase-like protein
MTNLETIYKSFPAQESCIEFLESVLWDDSPICPYCRQSNSSPVKNEHRYHCNTCNTSFGVITKTIFHKTKADLQKWFMAIYLLDLNPTITGRDLATQVGVAKDTGFSMRNRINSTRKNNQNLFSQIINKVIYEK